MAWADDEVVSSAPATLAKAAGATPKGGWKADPIADQVDDAVHKAKLVGSSVMRGLASLPAAFLDSPDPVAAQRAAFDPDQIRAKAAMDASQAQGPRLGPMVQQAGEQPTATPGDRYLNSMGTATGAALFPIPGVGATGPLRALATGVGSGGAAEAAGQFTSSPQQPQGDPLARLVGGLAGGAAGAVPMAGTVHAPDLVNATRSTVEAAGIPALKAADARAKAASATLGVPVLPTQGLPNPTPAQGLVAKLAQAPDTAGQVHSLLNAQQPSAMDAVRQLIDAAGAKSGQGVPIVPGQSEANAVRDAAVREVAERPVAKAAAVSNDAYRAGAQETLPASIKFSAPADIAAVQDTMRVLDKSDAGRAFLNRYKRVVDTSPIVDAQGQPFVKIAGDPMELYNFRKELSKLAAAGMKDSATGADITKSVGYQKMVGALDDLLAQHAPELTKANQLYARSMRVNSDPVRQGPLGQTVPNGADAAKAPAQWDDLNTVLANPDKYSPKDVTTLAQTLSRSDPKAFPNLVRQHLESQIDPLFTEGRQASTGEVARAMFGPSGSRQRENTLTAIAESARAQGRDPQAARAGADALADALEVVSHDRGGLGALTEAAGRSIMGGVGLRGPWVSTRGFQAGGETFNAQKVLDALTSPDAIPKLEKVASYSLARNRIKAALNAGKAASIANATDNQ